MANKEPDRRVNFRPEGASVDEHETGPDSAEEDTERNEVWTPLPLDCRKLAGDHCFPLVCVECPPPHQICRKKEPLN